MSNTLNFVLASPHDAADKIDEMEKRVEALEAALRQIIDWYENQNINHVDFRVTTCHLAMDALEDAGLQRNAVVGQPGKSC